MANAAGSGRITSGRGLKVIEPGGADTATSRTVQGETQFPREIHFWKQIDYTLTMLNGDTVLLKLSTDIATWPGIYVLTDETVASINGASGSILLIY